MPPPVVMALTLVFILAIGYTVYKQHTGSTAGCAVDADCSSGQTCVGGQCTGSSCKSPTDCGGRSCVNGTCAPPPPGGGTCTAEKMPQIDFAWNSEFPLVDLAANCTMTADGKWWKINNSWGWSKTNQLEPAGFFVESLDQCQQKCKSTPSCAYISFHENNNECHMFKLPGVVWSDNGQWLTYVPVGS